MTAVKTALPTKEVYKSKDMVEVEVAPIRRIVTNKGESKYTPAKGWFKSGLYTYDGYKNEEVTSFEYFFDGKWQEIPTEYRWK